MKKIFSFILIVTLFAGSLYSQTIQLIVSQNPSPYFSDWQNKKETAMLMINNPRLITVLAKIKTELYNGKGILIGETDVSKMPTLSITPGLTQYNAEDLYPLSAIKWYGASFNSIISTGRIPDDNYRLCIHLVNPQTGNPVTNQSTQCKTFNIVAYQAPVLIAPIDNAIIPITGVNGMLFRWTPVIPSANMIVTYRMQIWEVLEGQSNVTALRNNQPIVEKDFKGILQAQWPIDFALPEIGKKYVWTITPLDDQDRKIVEGYGFAEPFGFSLIMQNGVRGSSLGVLSDSSSLIKGGFIVSTDSVGSFQSNISNNSQSGKSTNTSNTSIIPDSTSFGGKGKVVVGDTISAGLNGEFKIKVVQVSVEPDSTLTGNGTVNVGWLSANIAVEFSKIRIDTTKRLRAGGIVTVKSAGVNFIQSWLLSNATALASVPVDAALSFTNNQVDNVITWVNNNVNLGQPIITYQSNIPPPPIPNNSLKMPFGIKFNANDLLTITEIIFKPTEAKVNFLAQKEFNRSNTTYKLGFAGKYFKIHPSNIDFTNGRVELVEDINVPSTVANPKMKFTFKKATTNSGCYIQWANNGITNINVGLDVKFTRDWLLPIPTSPDTVKATLNGSATSMHDILLTGNFPQCEFVGTNGMKMDSCQVSFDLSDIRNPLNIVFPANYIDSASVATWQGLYIKTFTLTLPETWKTNANATQITASNIIIDDMGLTTKIKAKDVIAFKSCKVADLSASLDTINISIVNSSLVSGNAKGKIVLPICKDSITNCLKYTASFSQANGGKSFQLVIVPSGPIEADILKGTMALDQTSNITALFSTDSIMLAIALNGSFTWKNPILVPAPLDTIINGLNTPVRAHGINGLSMELDFEDIGITYKHYPGGTPYSLDFSYGNWSFASPQKLLANFPVTIKNVRYKSLTKATLANPNIELLKGAILIDVVANLTEDIGGTTTLGAAFAIDLDKTAKKFSPKFKGVFVDSIAVHADLPAVKIYGALKMYDNDPMFGDGFLATLGVTFTSVSLQVNALVQFGNTLYLNNNQYYRYWRVEADAMFSPGIPFLTGVGFYGFGGGAFYNMEAHTVQRTAPAVGFKYQFTPKKSSLGLMAKATIGTYPKVETFNADVAITAQFDGNTGGLTMIGFTGDFWVAAKLTQRANAKMLGGVAINYTFPTKIFNLSGALTINAAPDIATVNPIALALHVDGRINKWYFKCGVPNNPNTVKVFGINLYSYFMFGNDLGNDVPDGFTQNFKNNYFNAIGGYPGVNHSTGGADAPNTVGNTATGKGVALGVGVTFNKNFNENIFKGVCRQWSINADLLAGAEVDLAFLEYSSCGSFNPFGINSYRATGALGLYFSLTSSIKGDHFCCYCSDKNWNLFTIKTGAWLIGKFPNPVFLYGNVSGQISLFNGLIDQHWSKYFEYGTDCSGNAVATANTPQQDKAADLKNNLIQYVVPNSVYNFPITSTINVKYSLTPNQVFDVTESEGDGTAKNRTFKLVTTTSIEVQNANGAWAPKTLYSQANNIGEIQYYIIAPPVPFSPNAISIGNFTPNILNVNSGNNIISNNGNIHSFFIQSDVPPPPVPSYPNPVTYHANGLTVNMFYRFIVTATLKELIGGNWVNATTRAAVPITETKTFVFKTGPNIVLVNNNGPSGNQ